MTGDTPCWYLALEANDTLRQRMITLQTDLFREFGLIEARVLPPLHYIYRVTGINPDAEPTKETGKSLLNLVKPIIPPPEAKITPPHFHGDMLFLPVKSLLQGKEEYITNSIRLKMPEQAAWGFLLLARGGNHDAETRSAIEKRGKYFFPEEEKLGKVSPLLILIYDTRLTGSSWKIYPLR